MKSLKKTTLLLVVVFAASVASQKTSQKDSKQPTIITNNGNIIFKSALNSNISFSLVGDRADVNIGKTSLKKLVGTVEKQKMQIQQLETQQANSKCTSKGVCGENGYCISVNQEINKDGYRCICRAGYTGKKCEKMDVCVGVHCMNGSKCIEVGGRGICQCEGNWFGSTCSMSKPKDCRYKVNEKAGIISSPGFPNGYPGNSDCSWEITSSPGTFIQLVVLETNIGTSPKCDKDSLRITDVASSSVLGTLCGMSSSQTHYSSSSNQLLLTFKTAKTPVGRGFSVYYKQVKNDQCGGVLSSAGGTFESNPNSDLPCIWMIDTKSEEKLKLEFDRVKITNPPDKCDNYLEVRSGNSYDSPLFEKHCHTNSSKLTMNTLSAKLLIKFVVKNKTSGDSIRGSYDTECGGMINLNIGEKINISSPFYPKTYLGRRTCKWTFHSPVGTHMNFRFVDLIVKNKRQNSVNNILSQICFDGKISVRDGRNYNEYCGAEETVPPPTSFMNQLIVEFMSTGASDDLKIFLAEIAVVKEKCTKTTVGSGGAISSPLYPSFYSENTECVYTMVAISSSQRIQLTFLNFDVQSDHSCGKDYIQIFDGPYTDAPLLYSGTHEQGRLCGRNAPAPTISSGRSLTVRFKSDALVNDAGFMAEWKQVHSSKDCNIRKTSPVGSIQSPSFPENYPLSSNCSYLIESQNGHIIRLDFQFFHLENSLTRGECDTDFLKIYDGPDNKSNLIGTFCGINSPRIIVSSGNSMFLEFHSDFVLTEPGFLANYTTGDNLCGGLLNDRYGFFQSPGFPNSYLPNQECHWVIRGDQGNSVTLFIASFEVEKSKGCQHDYVKIYEGESNHGKLLATLCGNPSRKFFKSHGNSMYIEFKTDKSIQWKGFRFEYQHSCTHYLTERKGMIISPGYPQSFPRNLNCRWIILGHASDRIRITSKDFQIDAQSFCSFGSSYVSISSPGGGTTRYCRETRVSFNATRTATVQFVSGIFGTDRGFVFEYVIEGCSQDFFNSSGTFNSPNYPQNYPSRQFCVWRIRVAEGKRIQLTFHEFDLESKTNSECFNDYVKVYNGYGSHTPSLGTFCSNHKTFQLTSTGNEMTVLFKSSYVVQRRGFNATFLSLDGGCGGIFTSRQGSLYSPGYPNDYPRQSLCHWNITTNSTGRIQINITNFHLEDMNIGSCRDYLEITDGKSFQNFGKYCGKMNSTIITSSGNSVNIKFSSDGDVGGKGFKIDYKTVCGGVINVGDISGYISSPHYPNYYEEGECQWVLQTTPGKRIHVQFLTINIRSCTKCDCDSVIIRDGKTKSAPLLGTYCGNHVPGSMYSSGDSLHINFTASSSRYFTGFKMMYTSQSDSCGGHLKAMRGSILTPFYPNLSPSPTDCVWTIEVAQGNIVDLSIRNITLAPFCDASNIKIFDGPSTNATMLRRLCSSSSITTIKSSTNFLTIQFNTNVPVNGFEAIYTTDCAIRNLTSSSGIIETPGFPLTYPHDAECSWILNVPEGHTATIQIERFDLEDRGFFFICFDYFVIYDPVSRRRLTINYCGNNIPSQFKFIHETPTIIFHSDSTTSRHGFKLSYSIDVTIPNCGGNLTATDIERYITSPNYPKEYPANTNCKWNLNTSKPGFEVEIEIQELQLEEDSTCSFDSVSLLGTSKSEVVSICTPDQLPSNKKYFSKGGKLTIDFKSDFSHQEKGFNISYKQVCKTISRATKGVINSYVDPNTTKYLPNFKCYSLVQQEAGGVIIVSFTKFKLESSTNCTKDYVEIRNGVGNDSQVIGKYCGSKLPNNITTTGHEMAVIFVTDSAENFEGFELVYERKILGCGGKELLEDKNIMYEIQSPGYGTTGLPSNIECEWSLNVPSGSIIEFTFSEFNLSTTTTSCSTTYLEITDTNVNYNYKFCSDGSFRKSIKSSDNKLLVKLRTGATNQVPNGFKAFWKIGCGRHFRGNSGSFVSPNFPTTAYPNNMDCLYSIELLDNTKQVQIHFPVFNLQTNSEDSVKIYEGLNTSNLFGIYKGTTVPNSIVSSTNKISLQFITDSISAQAGQGFKVDYSTVGTKCGGRLLGEFGTFSSPFFPQNYPSGRRCKWHITTTKTFAVELNITDLDIAYSENCTEDYLLIKNGANDDSPVLGRYCGTQGKILHSSGFDMIVEFVSNRDNNRGKGFRAVFTEKHPACGGKVTGTIGVITSPNFPNNYENEMDCTWDIAAIDLHNVIQLTFIVFELEEDINCDFDYLEISDGSTASSHSIDHFCGNRTGTIITSLTSRVHMRLRTDISGTFKGFSIIWNAKTPQCGTRLTTTKGEIKSPGYPSSYTAGGHTECFWIGSLSEGYQVHLTINELQLPESVNCSADRIVIQNGENRDSPIISTLCGNLTDPIRINTTGSHFRIHMISENANLTNVLYRFRISYTVGLLGCGGVINANSGIITSPGYPRFYEHNQECEWVVKSDPGTNIFVYMDDLDIRDQCRYDFLEIRNGDNINAQLIDRLCTQRFHASVYNSTSNKIYIRFVSDINRNGRGFKIHFNTGCGGILKGRRGFIATPNYPRRYPENQDCQWVFQISQQFTLNVIDISLNLPPEDRPGVCSRDYLLFYKGNNTINGIPLLSLCGKLNLPKFETKERNGLLQFKSDGQNDGNQYNGGRASYETVCGQHIRNIVNGSIDMRLQNGYYSNETCIWLIEFPAGKTISLKTTFFHLEGNFPTCYYDSVEIRDGRDENAPLMGKWCSNFRPHVQSSTNFLYIKFKTDHGVSGRGFHMEYSEASILCGGTLDLRSGQNELTSPNYPNELQPGLVCGWKLVVPENKRVNITFTTLNLRVANRLCEGFALIYDFGYPNDLYRRTGPICGSILPTPFITVSNQAYVTFHTQFTIQPSSVPIGFKLKFSEATINCGGVLSAVNTTKTLNVQNYPNGSNCEWLIRAPKDQKVSVKFTQFNFEHRDKDGNCNSRVLVKDNLRDTGFAFCGNSTPPSYQGTFESLVIQMNEVNPTDSFTLEYSSKSNCDKTYTLESGLVTSLNFPLDYPHHVTCKSVLTVPAGKIITLYSVAMDLEILINDVCADSLDVYDGLTVQKSGKLNNATICGKILPPTFKSTGNSLLLHFKSDSSLAHSGFAFTYVASDPNVCGGNVTGKRGAIATPNYPSYYGDNVQCEWMISVSEGQRVRIQINDFHTESGLDCRSADFTEIFDGSASWGVFCGTSMPAQRISTGNQIRVTFKSNQQLNDFRGFKLFFYEV